MSDRTVRTTITLPAELIDAADRAVREGRASSRDELMVAALRHELAVRDRAAIDAAFAALASDEAFQKESRQLAEEGARSGWEALQASETTG